MREYINLIENAYKAKAEAISEATVLGVVSPTDAVIGSAVAESDDLEFEVSEASELNEFAPPGSDEVSSDEGRLAGALDPRALAKLLPEVDDLNKFINAVRKVQRGDIASLNMLENRQLAKAFISLLRDDTQMTQKVFQKLRMVHSDAPESTPEV